MLLRHPQMNLVHLVCAMLFLCSVPSSRAEESADEQGESSAEVDSEQSAEELTDEKGPGYSLPPESRSPFLPASFYREQEEKEEEKQGLTEEFVQNHVDLNAIVNANGKMTAIINRTLLSQGDELTLEKNGQEYSLHIKEIKRNPPMAILTHKDQRFTVTAGQ
ncbi:MAG: hypothetical protein ACOCUY_01365 [Verrucomicrobiota bacterium]